MTEWRLITLALDALIGARILCGLRTASHMRKLFVCLCCLTVWSQAVMGQQNAEPRLFVFPKAGHCSIMLDVSPLGGDFTKASKVEQAAQALRYWFAAQKRDYSEKCPDSASIRLLVVRITAVDNYGRPDFANRENLFDLSGEPALFALARSKLDGGNPPTAESADIIGRIIKK